MVLIDQLVQGNPQSGTSFTYNLNVTSPEAIIVVMSTIPTTSSFTSATFNGNNMQENFFLVGGSFKIFFHIMYNPPVGTYPVTVNISAGPASISILSLLGVDKSFAHNYTDGSFLAKGGTPAAAPPSLNLGTVKPGSLILDVVNGGNPGLPRSEQYRFFYDATGGVGMSASYGVGNTVIGWQNSLTGAYAAIVFPPKETISISRPTITTRSPLDVLQANDLDQFNFAGADSPRRIFGRKAIQLFQNSFLHTIGRIGSPVIFPGSSTKGSFVKQNRIIVDNILKWGGNAVAAGNPANFTIPSQDSVLLVFITANNNTDNDNCFYNGVQLTRIGKASGGSNQVNVYYTNNPAVGSNVLTFTFGSGSQIASFVAISLLGVNKKVKNPIVVTNGSGNGLIQAPSANSLIIDAVSDNTVIPDSEQGGVIREGGGGSAVSFKYSYGLVKMHWTGAGLTQVIVALEPAVSASISSPNTSFRDAFDSSATNNFNYSSANLFVYAKPHPSNFFQNSFLHTIGRLFLPPPKVPLTTNETERPTSQIVIDKVFQGQTAAVAVSTVTLAMQVSIPSPDAVLVVTGGSVIATGAQWANVQFNGNKLTNLAQAAVAGADAEIWYMPNPPVGTYTLFITSGTGGEIYANAMVLLGVDKKNTNIIAASSTNAAVLTSIQTNLQNDSQGTLIIDTVSANDSVQPNPDQLQTQVFNATALAGIENVLSSYKIAQPGQVKMSYNLTTAVNSAMVAVAFRQAKAASLWNPNIDFRTIDDTVTVAGLDAERNPAFGNYGYKASIFYQNSFLHTVGRYPRPLTNVVPSTGSTLLLMGMG